MKDKLTVDELTRLAFIYAEQDRESFLDSIKHCDKDPDDVALIKETKQLLKQLKQYRIKRWGNTAMDSLQLTHFSIQGIN